MYDTNPAALIRSAPITNPSALSVVHCGSSPWEQAYGGSENRCFAVL